MEKNHRNWRPSVRSNRISVFVRLVYLGEPYDKIAVCTLGIWLLNRVAWYAYKTRRFRNANTSLIAIHTSTTDGSDVRTVYPFGVSERTHVRNLKVKTSHACTYGNKHDDDGLEIQYCNYCVSDSLAAHFHHGPVGTADLENVSDLCALHLFDITKCFR